MHRVAAAFGLGVALGVLLRRLRRARIDTPGWGWFTSQSTFRAPRASSLLVLGSKVPVGTGEILWLSDTPPELLRSEHTFVGAGENARVIDGDGAEEAVHAALAARCGRGCAVRWIGIRELLGLPERGHASQAEVEAVARAVSLLAWHRSHRFSGVDGQPTMVAAGTDGRRRKLSTGRTLYPRVDPVCIVLVESSDGERCLLGRQKTYPPGMWTCISGFVEHGESVEHAAAREVLEETGVRCTSTVLVASQPWPCGRGNHCELMLAVSARAESEDIDVHATCGGGGELEAARWFDRAQVSAMLERSIVSGLRVADGAEQVAEQGLKLKVPPPLAIAHHLIERWKSHAL